MKNLKLQQLSENELLTINGGDKFMKDLGNAIGSGLNWAERKMTQFSIYLADYSGNY